MASDAWLELELSEVLFLFCECSVVVEAVDSHLSWVQSWWCRRTLLMRYQGGVRLGPLALTGMSLVLVC